MTDHGMKTLEEYHDILATGEDVVVSFTTPATGDVLDYVLRAGTKGGRDDGAAVNKTVKGWNDTGEQTHGDRKRKRDDGSDEA
jgi:hypothetical protein